MSSHKPLKPEFLRSVLGYNKETGLFTWLVDAARNVKAGRTAGYLHPDGYVKIRINRVIYVAHRLAWLHAYGEWIRQSDFEIDHINRDKSDNRIGNLRLVSRTENMQNRGVSKASTSGYKGVFPYRNGRWQSAIRFNGKQVRIGYFDTKEEAHAAYTMAARKHHTCPSS